MRTKELHGTAFGLGAFVIWGLSPIYFKVVAHVEPAEVLAHRVVWALVLLGVILALTGTFRAAVRELCEPIQLLRCSTTALLVSINWLIFIWAIQNDRILEASLGYFINPLVSVALGVLLLGERMHKAQILAVLLAVAGVANLIVSIGELPWVSLSLAFSFGFYGLLHKKFGIGAVQGLFSETLLLLPLAAGYLCFSVINGGAAFTALDRTTDVLLIAAGVVTAAPLLLFLAATHRLALSTIGLMQYLAPSLNFVLAVFVYGEAFTRAHTITFVLIWTGLAIYTGHLLVTQKGRPAAPDASPIET